MQSLWRRLRTPAPIHVASLTSASYAAAAIGLLRTIAEARLLGPSDYGFAALVLAYPRFIWSFSSVKSLSVTSRYLSEFRATNRPAEIRAVCKLGYLVDIGAMLAALAIVVVTGEWAIRRGFAPQGSRPLMIAYSASLPIWALHGTSRAILSSGRRFGWLAAAQAIDAIVTFVLVVAALLAGFGVLGLVAALSLTQVTSGLLLFALAMRALSEDGVGGWWREPFASVAPLAREIAPRLGWSYVITTLSGALTQGPILLLGRSRGPTEAGYFRLATTIVGAASELPVSMGRVVYPTLSERWAISGPEGLRRTLWHWTSRSGLAVAVAMVIVIPFLPVAVPRLFGDGYEAMVPGLQWLTLGAAAAAPFFWLNPLTYATNRLWLWAVGSAIQSVVVFIIGAWVAPEHGYAGMAALLSISSIAFTLGLIAALWASPPR